jgi:hypothetical protein
MFCGTCIVVYLYNKDQQDALFTFNFIPINNIYMLRAGLLLLSSGCTTILYIQKLVYVMRLYRLAASKI